MTDIENEVFPVVAMRTIFDGAQAIFRFDNGYGASVISHGYSYGTELAVIKFNSEDNDDWDIVYDTPVTDNVIGNIADQYDLANLLVQIRSL